MLAPSFGVSDYIVVLVYGHTSFISMLIILVKTDQTNDHKNPVSIFMIKAEKFAYMQVIHKVNPLEVE